MLKIEHISKTFNPRTVNEKKALSDLSLSLEDGEFVTVIGSNGAGKSTLLNAIAGTWPLDEGKIIIDGTDITSLPDYKRAKFIGRVFQDPLMGTAADMWIEENMAIALRRGQKRTLAQGITSAQREQFRVLLKDLDLQLEERLSTKAGLLSGGQRQALTLLMASMNHPQLLLLDEHTAALDPRTAKKVLTITDKLVRENNLTTLMITHNMQDAIDYGDRLIMMNDGMIILDIKGEEKKNTTREELISRFNALSEEKLNSDNLLLTS